MDLCGPMRIPSRGGKKYIFVIFDNYSRFIWTLFLRNNDETFSVFVAFVKQIQVMMGYNVVSIRSDPNTEFDNVKFDKFCDENGISHNFSTLRTPQQNDVVERKNRTLSLLDKTPYKLRNRRKPKRTYLRAFGCKFFVLNNEASVNVIFDESHHSSGKDSHEKDRDGNFSKVSEEAINMKNGKTDLMSQVKEIIEENVAKSPAETEKPGSSISATEPERKVDDAILGTPDAGQRRGTHTSIDANDGSNPEEISPSYSEVQVSNWKNKISHPLQNVITPLDSNIQTISKEALKDADWNVSMQEELHQFERNKVWHLVPQPIRQNSDWNQVDIQKQT
ncbi:uncharacterized protein [Nicotiana sylvestris]|uniref:uncharacterized protein n=1 Tax=Nicotiana sylvestris TaxID=4096 RepID=UPI00388C7358